MPARDLRPGCRTGFRLRPPVLAERDFRRAVVTRAVAACDYARAAHEMVLRATSTALSLRRIVGFWPAAMHQPGAGCRSVRSSGIYPFGRSQAWARCAVSYDCGIRRGFSIELPCQISLLRACRSEVWPDVDHCLFNGRHRAERLRSYDPSNARLLHGM